MPLAFTQEDFLVKIFFQKQQLKQRLVADPKTRVASY